MTQIADGLLRPKVLRSHLGHILDVYINYPLTDLPERAEKFYREQRANPTLFRMTKSADSIPVLSENTVYLAENYTCARG